MLETVGWFE
jgi:hypothetical protein